jgi:hypothetical protein
MNIIGHNVAGWFLSYWITSHSSIFQGFNIDLSLKFLQLIQRLSCENIRSFIYRFFVQLCYEKVVFICPMSDQLQLKFFQLIHCLLSPKNQCKSSILKHLQNFMADQTHINALLFHMPGSNLSLNDFYFMFNRGMIQDNWVSLTCNAWRFEWWGLALLLRLLDELLIGESC